MSGRFSAFLTAFLCAGFALGTPHSLVFAQGLERQSGAPKPALPKVEPKKPEPKKPEPKKVETKKAEPKKAEPKKAEPKKVEPKKAESKKADSKKPEPKKTPSKETDKKKPSREEREKELAHEGPLLHFFQMKDGKCAWVVRNIGTEEELTWHETATCPDLVLWDPKVRQSTYNQGPALFRVAWPALPLLPEKPEEVEEPPGGGAPEPGAQPKDEVKKPEPKAEEKKTAEKKPEAAAKPPPESGDAGDTGGKDAGEEKEYELPEPEPAGKVPSFYVKRPGELYLWIDHRRGRLRMAVTNAPDGPPVERKIKKTEKVIEEKDGKEEIVEKEVEEIAWSFPYRGKMIDAPPKDDAEGAPARKPMIVVVRELRGEKWLSVERTGIWYAAGDGPPGQYTKSFQRRRGTILSLTGFLRSSSWLPGLYALRKERLEEEQRAAFRAAFTAKAGELPKVSADLSLIPLRRGAVALPVAEGKTEGALHGIAPVYFARRDGSRIGARLQLQKFAPPRSSSKTTPKTEEKKEEPKANPVSKPPAVLKKDENSGEVQVALPKPAEKPKAKPKPEAAPSQQGLNIARAGNYVLVAAAGSGNNAAVFKLGKPEPVYAVPDARAAIWIYFSDFWRTVPPREPSDIRKRKKKKAAKKAAARKDDKRRPVMTCDAKGCRPVRGKPSN